ncbi:MAG: transposase [Candidatus Aramenus sp.]|nr:transposase [Candidatus Aramenus sp.]
MDLGVNALATVVVEDGTSILPWFSS